ncbi:hypothetical protein CKF54_06900 [Psittacicella hinzii]|uniref:Alpha/beta hydrolase family protein n=1 Tax=Psittacicella hinzii TaxID=2028575 RepID=A0A3A1Y157_9GAMM|nr:alpha/beta hydrolase [Psittacicella hinzii]RIY31315.1 hypothetical protein CKF54_06900 [Psittacicella hinzii]
MRTQDAQANQISYNAYYLDQDGKVAEAAPLRTVDADTPNLPPVIKEFADYYRTDRGFHPRSINSNGSWATVMPMSYMNTRLMNYAQDIKVPTLIITGEVAHSRYFSERAFAKLSGTNDKELVIVPGANHVDLYDLVSGKLPMQKFVDFFNQKLNNN